VAAKGKDREGGSVREKEREREREKKGDQRDRRTRVGESSSRKGWKWELVHNLHKVSKDEDDEVE
jgi:hypothetical protein